MYETNGNRIEKIKVSWNRPHMGFILAFSCGSVRKNAILNACFPLKFSTVSGY